MPAHLLHAASAEVHAGAATTTLEGNIGSGVLVTDKGTLTARNSTVSEDSEFGVLVDGTASFFNSTIAFNTDGGIQTVGTLNLANTIVAENKGSY